MNKNKKIIWDIMMNSYNISIMIILLITKKIKYQIYKNKSILDSLFITN